MQKILHPSVIDFISRRKLIYLIGVFSIVLCNFSQVYFARAIGFITDFLSKGHFPKLPFTIRQEDQFLFLFLTIVISRVFLLLGRFGWRISLARQSHNATGFMRKDIWENARFFSAKDLTTKYPKGVLMNLANSDVNQARFIFGFTLVGFVDVVFLSIFAIASMVEIHLFFSIASLLILSATPFAVKKLSTEEIEKYDESQEYLSKFNDLASQSIGTVKLQKLGRIAQFWNKRLYSSADEFRKKKLSAQYTSLKYIPYMGITSIFCYITLFSYGSYLIYTNEITVGEFLALQGLIFILQDPLVEMGYIISDWVKCNTSLRRLDDVYFNSKESYLLHDNTKGIDHTNSYNIKGLSFKYDDKYLFKDFNLDIKHGDRIGVTGKIGTGKSTLMNILSGLERNFTGKVDFYGDDFSVFSHPELRGAIVYVHQKPFLFAQTIRSNITLNRDLSDDEIWRSLELAGLKDDVTAFPNKLETQLGEWGINLSGGQKQRLTLARALSYNPKVLLLDDVLSAVDTVTEEKILHNLDRELKDTTIIWVAHRKSTLKYCDKIINLDEI